MKTFYEGRQVLTSQSWYVKESLKSFAHSFSFPIPPLIPKQTDFSFLLSYISLHFLEIHIN